MLRNLAILLSVTLLGCGPKESQSSDVPSSNVQEIAMLYMTYMHSSGGVAPPSAKEFKQFIRTKGTEEAKSLKIDLMRLEDLFVSPREGKAIIVNYGRQLRDRSQTLPIIAYESQGREGMRTIAFLSGMVKEVDAKTAVELGLKASS